MIVSDWLKIYQNLKNLEDQYDSAVVQVFFQCLDYYYIVTTIWMLELDRYIGNTHHRGRLWDNRNHRQMMTISDQSVPMFHDDITHWIHLAMCSIGHPCRTIQGSARYMSLMTVQALREVSICDEARPTTHAVLLKLWLGYLSLIKLFF